MIKMAKNQISFFATRADLLELLSDVVSLAPFQFSHLDIDGEPAVTDSAADLDDLGVMTVGDQNQGQTYLLIDPSDVLTTRSVEKRNGEVKVFYDQKSHPKSVILRSGGLLVGSNCMIAGQIGTASEDLWSIALSKTFFSSIKKRFTKIQSFYIGYEAATMLDDGFRLTTNIKAPTEYDVHR